MKLKTIAAGALLGAALVLPGCSVPREAGFPDVRKLLADRSPWRVHWNQGTAEDTAVAETVARMLTEELTADRAVQIALLSNHGLQAEYEELGVAQADVVQAGLLTNPVFGFSARFPDRAPSRTNTDFDIVQNFLDLLTLPSRSKIAKEQFERTKLRVAQAVLDLAAQVKAAYFTVLSDRQVAEMRGEMAKAAQVSYEFNRRMAEAGNLNEMHLAIEEGANEQAKTDLLRAQARLKADRVALSRLLGVWSPGADWRLPDKLPALPAREVGDEGVEEKALAKRMDLAAAGREVAVLTQARDLARSWRWLGAVDIGASRERDTDGQVVTGPSISLELPIFDQHQASIARLDALVRQAEQRRQALEVDVRNEARAAVDRLLAARKLSETYLKVLIPVRERALKNAMPHYNYMLIGVFALLELKRAEIDAYLEYIEALRDYWIARAELERAVGGGLEPHTP
ncbi:MAG: TolC family protein [Planctomycetes bacterium]|nr:TolC family protein [Planctomycetota bacterium]